MLILFHSQPRKQVCGIRAKSNKSVSIKWKIKENEYCQTFCVDLHGDWWSSIHGPKEVKCRLSLSGRIWLCCHSIWVLLKGRTEWKTKWKTKRKIEWLLLFSHKDLRGGLLDWCHLECHHYLSLIGCGSMHTLLNQKVFNNNYRIVIQCCFGHYWQVDFLSKLEVVWFISTLLQSESSRFVHASKTTSTRFSIHFNAFFILILVVMVALMIL